MAVWDAVTEMHLNRTGFKLVHGSEVDFINTPTLMNKMKAYNSLNDCYAYDLDSSDPDGIYKRNTTEDTELISKLTFK